MSLIMRQINSANTPVLDAALTCFPYKPLGYGLLIAKSSINFKPTVAQCFPSQIKIMYV
jgi:hypothetical protein